MQETSWSESSSPIIAHKQLATMLIESQTPKQQWRQQKGWTTVLADSIDDFGQQMLCSSSQMSESFKSTSQQAMQAFIEEANDLLPEEWKERGRIPFTKIQSILRLLWETDNCETYLALLSGDKEYHLEWIHDILHENGEDVEVV